MSAPQLLKKPQRSHISGSRAALFITVSPSAVTAQSMTFSVAPTEGNARFIFAPFALPAGALQIMLPPISLISIPIFLSADMCISIGRGPSSQPPGTLTVHSPALPSMAPINIIEERISRISSSDMDVLSITAESITAVLSENVHLQPTQLSILEAA